MEELKENLDNIDDEVNEEIEVKNEIVEEKSIDTEETVIKDFFIKETGITLKEMAILFGQTEEEISKEYGSFKAKKVYAKLDYILEKPNISYEDFKNKCQSISSYGFKSITVLPNFIGLSKDLLAPKKVQVKALISYPHGEEHHKVKVYSARQALKLGADGLCVVVSTRMIRNGNYKLIVKNLKRIVKMAKNKPVTAILDANLLSSFELDKICKIISKECKLYSVMPYFFKEDNAKYEEVAKELKMSVNGKCHVDFGGEISTVNEIISLFTLGVNSISSKSSLEIASELNNKIISGV